MGGRVGVKTGLRALRRRCERQRREMESNRSWKRWAKGLLVASENLYAIAERPEGPISFSIVLDPRLVDRVLVYRDNVSDVGRLSGSRWA